MSDDIDLAHLREWIGRTQVAEDIVTPSLVDRFNATIGLEAAPARMGEAAPRLLHFCLCLAAVAGSDLGPDGHPHRGGFLPAVPLPRRMWAGSTIAFDGDLAVGEAVRRESTIASVEMKEGRGGTLCFVEVDHRIVADGRDAVTERQTLVYREPPSAAQSKPPEAARRGETVASVAMTSPLLFRYSAITFNAHRIHYDRPYAIEEEGYPGLVVQGPLQATLLYHFAARCCGTAPDSFTFRGLSPAIGDQSLELHAGAQRDGQLDLWSAAPDGPVAMQASANWRPA